jgi:hypothetical protein
MRKLYNGHRLTALVFLVVGMVFLKASRSFEPGFADDSLAMGPMAYPIWLIYGWILMSLLYFITARPDLNFIDISKSKTALLRAVLIIGCYFFIFPWLGLFASSFVFFVIFLLVEGYRNYKRVIPIAFFSAFLFWLVFEQLLKISMPRGVLIFWD